MRTFPMRAYSGTSAEAAGSRWDSQLGALSAMGRRAPKRAWRLAPFAPTPYRGASSTNLKPKKPCFISETNAKSLAKMGAGRAVLWKPFYGLRTLKSGRGETL